MEIVLFRYIRIKDIFEEIILYNEAFVKNILWRRTMKAEIVITVVIILGMVFLIDKIYGKINIENYSSIWEYFSKALLYGFIASVTLFYEKNR